MLVSQKWVRPRPCPQRAIRLVERQPYSNRAKMGVMVAQRKEGLTLPGEVKQNFPEELGTLGGLLVLGMHTEDQQEKTELQTPIMRF